VWKITEVVWWVRKRADYCVREDPVVWIDDREKGAWCLLKREEGRVGLRWRWAHAVAGFVVVRVIGSGGGDGCDKTRKGRVDWRM